MFGRSKPLRFTICQEQRLNLYLINNLFVIISLKNSDAKSTLYQRQININVHTYDPLSNLINTHTHRDLYELLSFSSLSKPKKKKNKKKPSPLSARRQWGGQSSESETRLRTKLSELRLYLYDHERPSGSILQVIRSRRAIRKSAPTGDRIDTGRPHVAEPPLVGRHINVFFSFCARRTPRPIGIPKTITVHYVLPRKLRVSPPRMPGKSNPATFVG